MQFTLKFVFFIFRIVAVTLASTKVYPHLHKLVGGAKLDPSLDTHVRYWCKDTTIPHTLTASEPRGVADEPSTPALIIYTYPYKSRIIMVFFYQNAADVL
jgi:hypothetical protein